MQNTFVERQRKLVAELKCLVDQRAALEGDIDGQHVARNEAMLQQYRSCRDQQTADFEKANTALRAEYQKLREQIIFPEVDYDKVEKYKGMNITIGTSAVTDEEAFALLKGMGMPFRKQA